MALGCELPSVLPLHRRFPGTRSLPTLVIAELPTSVERLDGPLGRGTGSLSVKRDDLTASAYGGNKVRKLEFTLARALGDGRRAIITFGALGSNHVLATAVHGTAVGLDVHAVLTPQVMTAYLPHNVAAVESTGAALHPVASFDEVPRAAARLRAELRDRDGIDPLVIPFGGTCPESDAGFVNAALELAEQVGAGVLPEPDLVYVPLGSAGTAIGLAIGFAAAGMKTRVRAIRVVPAEVAAEDALRATAEDAIALLREYDAGFPALSFDALPLEIRHEFFGMGYAVPTSEGVAALCFAEEAGLRLETTYTAKALAALRAHAAAGELEGRDIVFWNTYNSRPLRGSAPRDPQPVLPDELARHVLPAPVDSD